MMKKHMKSIVYHIPVSEMKNFQEENLIVRFYHLSELSEMTGKEIPENILYIQVPVQDADITPLMRLQFPVPLDLRIHDPVKDLPFLYNYAPLSAKCPVRVSLPVAAGFSKAAKLAVSLHFAVKLEVLQPEQNLIAEMAQVLNEYLHLSTVSQPIEFFHSLLLAFYHGNPVTLWDIQEENPDHFRFITDEGKETLALRLSGQYVNFSSFTDLKKEFATGKTECSGCEFIETCCAYFKFPCKEYSCRGIKEIFHMLKQAAEELKKDMELSAAKEKSS